MPKYSTITESLLYKQLAQSDIQLAASVAQCWQMAEKELRHIASVHAQYTSHGPDHSLALLRILDNMCPDLKMTLSNDEAYVLVCATILHDTGMLGPVGAPQGIKDSIRDDHHMRSYHRIKDNLEYYSLQKPYGQAIAEVAAAHRKIDIAAIKNTPIDVSYGDKPRVRLCATLLRIADECHITHDRVPDDYAQLELPSESAKHFAQHLASTGPHFDASNSSIEFSVEIETEAMSDFMRKARDKIETEVRKLEPALKEYGIPYWNIRFIEGRESILTKKVKRLLLDVESASAPEIVELLSKEGEDKEESLRFITNHKKAIGLLADEKENLSLDIGLETARDLAIIFVENPERSDDPWRYICSKYARRVTRTNEFTMLIRRCIVPPEPFDMAMEMVRWSPCALSYVLRELTTRPISSSAAGGTYSILLGFLKLDIESYPDILLVPDLVDKIYQDGAVNKNEYAQMRVLQGTHYFRAFDVNKVIRQWVLHEDAPNEREQEEATRPHKGKMNFSVSGGTILDSPLLMFAASLRMRLPFAMQESDKFRFTMTVEGVDVPEIESGSFSQLMVAPQAITLIDGLTRVCPVGVTEDAHGDITLVFHTNHKGQSSDWQTPLHGKIRLVAEREGSESQEPHQNLNVDYSLALNWDGLDCVSARTIAKLGSAPAEVKFALDGLHEQDWLKVPTPSLPLIKLNDEAQEVLNRLAMLQSATGKKIWFPQTSMNLNLLAIIPEGAFSPEEGQRVLGDVERMLRDSASYCTPVVAEVWIGETIVERIQLARLQGFHVIRLNPGPNEPANSLAYQAKEHPEKGIQVWGNSNKSAEEVLKSLELHDADSDSGISERVSTVVRNSAGVTIEELQTRIAIFWHPEEDKLTYKSTMFRIALIPLRPWERWSNESAELLKRHDLPRSYFAAKESFRLNPNDPDTVIQYGWVSYKLGMYEQALRITSSLLNTENTETRYLALINCAISALRLSESGGSDSDKQRRSSLRYYRSALEMLMNSPSAIERNHSIHLAFDDLLQDFNQIGSTGKWFMDELQNLQRGELTLESVLEHIDQRLTEPEK